MSASHSVDDLDPAQIYFLPLGGSEEFGVNFNCYYHQRQWLVVDCGIGFADERFPLVDILLPDPAFIADKQDDLAGLVITHAHEDHIGAVTHLWPRLGCPVYCSPFTASVLRRKLHEAPQCRDMEIIEIHSGQEISIGAYAVTPVPVSHSIPQTRALLISTQAGKVFHSADWNMDPTPVLDKPTDKNLLKQIGDQGVMAYIGDSTNALVPGRSGSESGVETGLEAVFKARKGRVAVTMFASNVGRIQSIAKAAQATGRSVCVLGRSLHKMISAARENGYLADIPAFIDEKDIDSVPDENLVLVLTGSQGEPRAALARIARGDWSEIKLGRGDCVIFSSREIPGNEKGINQVKNDLSAGGVDIIAPQDTDQVIHVSGHPYADEIREMYDLVRPQCVIPVHGERLMLEGQARLARDHGVEHVIVPGNGTLIRLGPETPEVVDHIPAGMLAVEPQRILSADDKGLNERRKLQFTGVLHISLALDDRGDHVCDPQISTMGLVEHDSADEREFVRDLRYEIADIMVDIEGDDLDDDHFVSEEIRIGLRRYIQQRLGMKPKTSVHLMRV